MPTSAYIHIPFCKSKCKYCSFVSFADLSKKSNYVSELINEIKTIYKGESLNTLYFGGGTPSLLKSEELRNIIQQFNLTSDCEITIEINPDDANLDYFTSLHEIGINRLSIGSQTFKDEILKLIGRRHSSKQIVEAVKQAQSVGFTNISVDLMYGLPNNFEIESDLEEIIKLGIQHVSTYGLKIEENSYFFKHKPLQLPDDDLQAEMYLKINNFLSTHNFNRYEISNFALKGFESKHNLNYWKNEEYYGFGLAAHGYLDGIRYSNFTTFEKYFNNLNKQENKHLVTLDERIEEEIFLGFRKEEGLNVEDFNNKFGLNFEQKYENVLKKYAEYFIKTEVGYKLTVEGVLLSNYILSDFLS